jgi:hypothetical protein
MFTHGLAHRPGGLAQKLNFLFEVTESRENDFTQEFLNVSYVEFFEVHF